MPLRGGEDSLLRVDTWSILSPGLFVSFGLLPLFSLRPHGTPQPARHAAVGAALGPRHGHPIDDWLSSPATAGPRDAHRWRFPSRSCARRSPVSFGAAAPRVTQRPGAQQRWPRGCGHGHFCGRVHSHASQSAQRVVGWASVMGWGVVWSFG